MERRLSAIDGVSGEQLDTNWADFVDSALCLMAQSTHLEREAFT
jgi:hypothetical protein